jgi:hypothetical protein
MKAELSFALATVLVAASADAQAPQVFAPPFSADFTVGPDIGHGGANPGLHPGIAIDLLAAWRARIIRRGSFVLGFSATLRGSPVNTDECEPAAGGGCVPRFPDTHAVGLLAGVERGIAGRASVRLLGGVARYGDADNDIHTALGIQGRLDLATAAWHRIAFVTSARAALVPNLRGDAYQFGALGFGLRFE